MPRDGRTWHSSLNRGHSQREVTVADVDVADTSDVNRRTLAPSARTRVRRGRADESTVKGRSPQQASDAVVKHHVPVDAAVWAELMRTRFSTSPAESALSYLQAASQCNVHIDRARFVVHLGGRTLAVQLAQMIVAQFAACVKKEIITGAGLFVNEDDLTVFGEHFKCTLVKMGSHVAILGLEGRVNLAAQYMLEQVRCSSGFDIQFKMDKELASMFELDPMAVRTATTRICDRAAEKQDAAKKEEAHQDVGNVYGQGEQKTVFLEAALPEMPPSPSFSSQSLRCAITASGLPHGSPEYIDADFTQQGFYNQSGFVNY